MDDFNISSDKFTINDINDIDKSKPGFIYDVDGDFSMENIPNVDELADKVVEILEYACTSEVINIKKANFEDYRTHMEEKFPQFCDRFYAIFQKIISGEDIKPLFFMLDKLRKVKSGNLSIEDAEKSVGMKLYNQFVKDTVDKL